MKLYTHWAHDVNFTSRGGYFSMLCLKIDLAMITLLPLQLFQLYNNQSRILEIFCQIMVLFIGWYFRINFNSVLLLLWVSFPFTASNWKGLEYNEKCSSMSIIWNKCYAHPLHYDLLWVTNCSFCTITQNDDVKLIFL